jgi:hypothetical protein
MSNSGTYTFAPPIGVLTLNAFSRINVKRTELLTEHMENSYLECNLLQADWSSDGLTWWTVQQVSQPLTAGTPTYLVASNVISVLDVYVSPSNGTSGQNRLLFPFSRTDYASLGNPAQQGFPTSFWYDRALQPTLTLWPVPDNSTTYLMTYYIYTQQQDANLRQGGNAAVPYWWLDAYVADLAHRLSRHHAPALEAVRKQDKIDAYSRASKQVEPAPLYLSVGLSSYFR